MIGLRAATSRLLRLHGRFAPLFRGPECQEHALGYLRGLLLAEGRKSIEPMALMFVGRSEVEPEIAQSIVLSWQRFFTVSPWEAQAVQQEIQAVFNEEFIPRRVSGWRIIMSSKTQRDLQRKVPELTLNMAMRMLRSAMPRPQLSLEDTEDLVSYHLDRNREATESHRKT